MWVLTQFVTDHSGLQTHLNLRQLFFALRQRLRSFGGNGDLFAAAILFVHGNQPLILQQIKRRIDHSRARAIVALGQGFNGLNQLVTVAGVILHDVENDQTKLTVAEETLATSAAVALTMPAAVFALAMPAAMTTATMFSIRERFHCFFLIVI